MRRKVSPTRMKISLSADARGVKHLYSTVSGINKIPSAAYEGCVLVPFALTACIPESAIRKFAAKKAFVVHVNGDGVEHSVFYFGDGHSISPTTKS